VPAKTVKQVKFNRRRFERRSVELPATIVVPGREDVPASVLNLSRGGFLLDGDHQLRNQLYRRKNAYTRRPRAAVVVLQLPGGGLLQGSGVFLRRLDEDHYQVGFRFRRTQSRAWLLSVLRADERRATGT